MFLEPVDPSTSYEWWVTADGYPYQTCHDMEPPDGSSPITESEFDRLIVAGLEAQRGG